MIPLDANIKRFRRLEAEIAEGEADNETRRWEQAKLAAEAVEGGMSARAYADVVDRDPSGISRYVHVWRRWGAEALPRPRFVDALATVQAGSEELITMADKSRRQKERQEPTVHEDRVEMAAKLLSDPAVVRGVMPTVLADNGLASRLVSQAARDKEHAERVEERARTQKHRRIVGEPGLDPIVWNASVRMREWAIAIDGLSAEFRALRDGPGKDALVDSTGSVMRACERMLANLGAGEPELGEFADVIDIRPSSVGAS